MATYENGVNGPFRGKVGSIIGSSWRGLYYMKGRPDVRREVTPSAAQQDQRNKLDITGSFMRSMKRVVKLGFDSNMPGRCEYNNATSYVMQNALDSTTTPYSIRYDKVLVTRGKYPCADHPPAVPGDSGMLLFTWADDTGVGVAKANDKVVLVAYSAAMNQTVFDSNNAIRSAGRATLDVSVFSSQTVETYIAFLKADGTAVSSSIYTGRMML